MHRRLDARFGAAGGPWRTDFVPYTREWMDASLSPWVRQVTIRGSTQIGKTEALYNVLGYFCSEDPTTCMVVMPRRPDVNLVARKRIVPMFRCSPTLRNEMTGAARDVSQRDVTLRRASILIRQATSPADLAVIPIQIVLADEVDKWPIWSAREANPLELVRERQRTYRHTARMYASSTPGAGDSAIMREWKDGDRRSFHVPCPHCGTFVVLQWQRVKWPDDITTENQMRRRREAWYECQKCDKRINDAQKNVMVQLGEWVPEGKSIEEWRQLRDRDETAHRSYHLWAAYSPWLSWWEIVAQWLRSRGIPDREQNFFNSWLAEPFDDRVENTTTDALRPCVQPWPQGTVPKGVALLTMAVDVQKDWLAWQVQGWLPGGTSVVIAAGTAETFWGIDKPLYRTWGGVESGLRVRLCLVDSRAREGEVLDFVRTRPECRAIKGVRRRSSMSLFSTSRIDRHPKTGAALPDAVICWTVNVGPFRDRAWAAVQRSGSAKNPNGRLLLPNDLPESWFDQMASEHKIRKQTRDGPVLIWVKKPGIDRNEAFDLTTYNFAAAAMMQAHKLRDGGTAGDDDDQVDESGPSGQS